MQNEITDKMIWAAARAMCEAQGIDPNEPTFASGASNGDYVVHERQVHRKFAVARAALSAALAQSADAQEPEAWKTQRYERGMWVETNMHLDEPTATDDLVVIPLYDRVTPTTSSKPMMDEKPYGWVIRKRGKRRAMLMLADDFDESSAAAEADIDDLGYFPIYARPSPPSEAVEARRLALDALEEAAEFLARSDYPNTAQRCTRAAAAIRALTQKDKAHE